MLGSIISGRRPVRKPAKREVNGVELDCREILKVRKWKRDSLYRKV
jgi:hypothetical protein